MPKRQFEELVIRAAQDFEAFYAHRQAGARADPHAASILVLTVDGKGVVMRPEDLREPTQRAAAARAKTFTARLGSGRRLHAKRMAAVAAIYTVEPYVRTPEEILPDSPALRETGSARPRPEHKRVWASLAQSPEAVMQEMFEEAAHRDPKGQKRWVALVDGNLPQIDHLQQMAEERNIPLIIVVDFIHVAQYVWRAAGAFFPNQEVEPDRWTRGRLLEILRGKASLVAAGMRRSATLRRWLRQSGNLWTTVPTISLTTRRIFSTTRRWPRGFPSPLGSLKAPASSGQGPDESDRCALELNRGGSGAPPTRSALQ